MLSSNSSIANDWVRVAQGLDPRYFHLILFPTEQCSFRCTYCYEDFERGKMKPSVVSSIKAFLSRRVPSLKELELSWFGGEPLLAINIIFDVQKHALGIQAGATVRGNITTNGYHLDSPKARKLINLAVTTFQISLDGMPSDHNRTRRGKGGFNTFDRIWHNLNSLKDVPENFLVILRVHFHPGNLEGVRRLADLVANSFGSDGRFKIFFKGINRLGGKNDHTLPVFSYKEQHEIKQRLVTGLDSSMIYSHPAGEYMCYASRMNSLAIRSDGSLAKCTVALNDRRNSIGRITEEGKLDIEKGNVEFWTRGLITGDAATLACPLHGH